MKLQSWSHSRPTPRRQLKKLITKGQKADEENFRNDVNANGHIEQSDIGLIRQQQGTALP